MNCDQVSILRFANGVTATFHLSGFTNKMTRTIKEVDKLAVEMSDISTVNPEFEGKEIHAIGDAKTDSKHVSIELGKDGLKITFPGHRDIRQLQTRPGLEKVQARQTAEKMTLSRQLEEDGGLQTNDVGKDSALDVEFSFRIRAKELDRLAGENFLDEGFRVKASGTTCRDFKVSLTVNG